MSKHEAVDRLMALAMEKRADRVPTSPVRPAPETLEILDPIRVSSPAAESAGADPSKKQEIGLATNPAEAQRGPSAADRGRQFLQAIRPLLPAVAGAMRMVDHGAVQAVARLLPLLGVSASLPGATAPKVTPEQEEAARFLLASHQALRKDVDALTLQLATADDLLGRTRTQLERLAAELAGKESETRALSDRVRLLSAGLIILLMLIIAQMILLVILLHK